ncbi:hypothetical protein Rsub_08835 [Raphidocelis subcapitata]|uniref:YCII-related domain-containing protein n=1 Tax=Raphidocelis subcapitata TaxID=307507 RepID=A0A2V0PDP4_9CHLO|nr:hypothetical protein Rsub_08835 [Raphidocelis subcapitata]|eukprot:GBF96020.1 hypothetical protein Rsub_08835 [Raphidocelis subcapitata]
MAASGAVPPPPKYWVLRYEYVADILERRGPYREAHLRGAQAKLATGQLVCAGATGTPPDGGLFLFKDISQEDVEAFVTADPYFKNGLITSYKISNYAVAVAVCGCKTDTLFGTKELKTV